MANQILTAAEHYIAAENLPGVKGADWLSAEMKAQAVGDALRTYSRSFPRIILSTIEGDGTALYDLSEITTWVEGFSTISEIEFPYSASELGDNVLHESTWQVVDHPTNGKTLKLTADTPVAGQSILVKFGVIHADGDPASTVRPDHVGAVGKLGASYMARALATRMASQKESTVSGGWNSMPGKNAYDTSAKKLREDYDAETGGGSDGLLAASGKIAEDRSVYTSHGYGRLTKIARRI